MNATCAIWGVPASNQSTVSDAEVIVSSRAGGGYRISRSLSVEREWLGKTERESAKVTSWLIAQRASGEPYPLLTTSVFNEIKRRPEMSIQARRDASLRMIASRSKSIGHQVRFFGIVDDEQNNNINDLQIATESANPSEALEFIHFLVADGLATQVTEGYKINFAGWSYLEADEKQAAYNEQAFVAMWFDKSMQDAYTLGIEPAVIDAGYRPIRIDKKEHINKIDDEIVAEIRRSKFLIADFTSASGCPRGGVYFEAGFAFGLNKPVIWTCRADLIDEVHFDTRQYNHIVWSDTGQLREALFNRITAVLGDGPLKKLS